jgi:hypothetical protein
MTQRPVPDEATVSAIIATVLDYYEGWFEGDASRMQRALHPKLAKRSVVQGDGIETNSAQEMIAWTAEGVGRRPDRSTWHIDVQVDAVSGSIATASASGGGYTDYLQLVRTEGRWQILNVLWARG